MKKHNYLMTLIVANLLIAESLMAQFGPDRISVVGGLNYCTITGDNNSWKGTIGGQGGVIVNVVNLNNSLSARGEFVISLIGAGWEDDYGQGAVSGRTNLTYLTIPLVLRYQTEGGFFGEAGVQPAFLLAAKDKYEGESVDYKEYLSMFDFSILFEIGYEFENNLGVGLRATPGLTNINSKDYADQYKDHNFVLTGRVTYTFKKK